MFETQEAIRGDFGEVAQLLKSHGGKIHERQKVMLVLWCFVALAWSFTCSRAGH